ncbi:hypothetical protein EXU48_12805 [Occultella glacieicola]|uniref:Uncharacterized protein n=1 Tax=Occultella glacieicola TaxID=2518684 RepID=A0ABY2E1I2_9MICO|nr:hypothetical protein [Occultella glacieicola]TDE92444.1 hypothetical protein EXU48_12805 [Occultella glacieicola]
MPDFVAQLEGLDLAQIDATLGRVRSSLEQAQELGIGGLEPTVLLGDDLGTAIRTVSDLGAEPDGLARLGRIALEELGGLIEIPELGDLDRILAGIGDLVELITQVASVIATDGSDGRGVLDRILTTVGGSIGLEDLVAEVTRRAAATLGVEIPASLAATLSALERLGSAGTLPSQEVASLLATVFVGLDLGDLSTVTASTTATLTLVTGAGNRTGLDAAVAGVRARLSDAYDLIDDGAEVDITALVGAIDAIGTDLDGLGSDLDRFVAGLATDLRTAANTMTELDLTGRTERLLAALPLPEEDLPRVMVDSLANLAEMFEAMTVEALETALTGVTEHLTGLLTAGPVGDLMAGIDDVFAELGRLMDALPLRSARDALLDALAGAQQEILAFDGFAFLDDLLAPVRDLERAVRDLDLSTITEAVDAVVAQVNGVFTDFPIEDLRDAVDAVIEPLGEILDELTPVVLQIADELEGLVAELEGVDFEAAGTATLDLFRGIRDQVREAVDGGDVPEAVKVVVAGTAAVLAELDLAAELTAPFDDAIAGIDVGALLQPIEEVWQSAGDTLRRATPAALIAELDPPFDELLAKVDQLSVAPLIGSLSELFGDLLSRLTALDPRALMAPLEQEFQALLHRVRALLDPGPLFAPLRAAYEALRTLVDGIDIDAAVRAALGGLIDVPDALNQAVGGALAASGGGGAAVPTTGAVFRFGDVLRPAAAFVGEIRSRLDSLADDVLGAALAQLSDVTRALWSLLDPAAGFAVSVADALDARLALADPNSGVGPVAELRSAVESFTAAVARIEVDADARLRLETATGSLRFDSRVRVSAETGSDLSTHAGRVRDGAGGTELGRSTRLLARSLERLLPRELLGGPLNPSAAVDVLLDAVFDRLPLADLADQLDAIGDRIQARLLAFADELSLGLFRVWTALFASLEPLLPDSLIARIQAGLDSVFARLDVLDPAVVEGEVRAVVDAAVSLLGVHSPAALARELGAVFDAALDRVRELDPATLLGDLDPFAGLKEQLELLRPSVVLEPLVLRAESFTVALETIAGIDLSFVGELVADIRGVFTTVLDGVETEWDALLAELAQIGGSAGVSTSVSTG